MHADKTTGYANPHVDLLFCLFPFWLFVVVLQDCASTLSLSSIDVASDKRTLGRGVCGIPHGASYSGYALVPCKLLAPREKGERIITGAPRTVFRLSIPNGGGGRWSNTPTTIREIRFVGNGGSIKGFLAVSSNVHYPRRAYKFG